MKLSSLQQCDSRCTSGQKNGVCVEEDTPHPVCGRIRSPNEHCIVLVTGFHASPFLFDGGTPGSVRAGALITVRRLHRDSKPRKNTPLLKKFCLALPPEREKFITSRWRAQLPEVFRVYSRLMPPPNISLPALHLLSQRLLLRLPYQLELAQGAVVCLLPRGGAY